MSFGDEKNTKDVNLRQLPNKIRYFKRNTQINLRVINDQIKHIVKILDKTSFSSM